MRNHNVGDRVQVTDPALAQMREIMRRSGIEPKPNHTGTVSKVWDDSILIDFDDGCAAPYPFAEVIPLDGDPIR